MVYASGSAVALSRTLHFNAVPVSLAMKHSSRKMLIHEKQHPAGKPVEVHRLLVWQVSEHQAAPENANDLL